MSALAQVPEVKLPPFINLLDELVRIPSISSPAADWDQGNLEVIQKLAKWFDALGFSIEIMHLPHAPDKANLIATLGTGDNGLVLAGHTDTVPYDQTRWQTDPFKLNEQNQKLYGLGTCDMKGFFPIIIEALRALHGAKLKQPLIVLATADEESSMSGARALAGKSKPGQLIGRAAVIGEPTSIRPIRMHKGILMESISVTGRSGHSSNPDLGCNALEGMQSVMTKLLNFRSAIQQSHQNSFFDIPVPTLNLGRIHGGDSPNRICGHCELSFDLRPLPGMDILKLRQEIEQLSQEAAKQTGTQIEIQHLIEDVPPFETGAETELVELCERLTGSDAEAVAFATEAPFLNELGFETIVMGAGSIDQAHQPNEFLALDQINPMATVLQKLIAHYCL